MSSSIEPMGFVRFVSWVIATKMILKHKASILVTTATSWPIIASLADLMDFALNVKRSTGFQNIFKSKLY